MVWQMVCDSHTQGKVHKRYPSGPLYEVWERQGQATSLQGLRCPGHGDRDPSGDGPRVRYLSCHDRAWRSGHKGSDGPTGEEHRGPATGARGRSGDVVQHRNLQRDVWGHSERLDSVETNSNNMKGIWKSVWIKSLDWKERSMGVIFLKKLSHQSFY